jgi:hypothetical protein
MANLLPFRWLRISTVTDSDGNSVINGIPDYGGAGPCFLPGPALAEADSPAVPTPVQKANAPPTGRTGCTICPLLHSYSMSKWIPSGRQRDRSDGRCG